MPRCSARAAQASSVLLKGVVNEPIHALLSIRFMRSERWYRLGEPERGCDSAVTPKYFHRAPGRRMLCDVRGGWLARGSRTRWQTDAQAYCRRASRDGVVVSTPFGNWPEAREA